MENDPTNPSEELQALLDHLQGFIAQDRFVDAMELFNTVRPAFPEDPSLAALGAYVFLRLDLNEQAVELGMEAFNQGSQDPMTALVLGVACRNCGRHAEAAEALLAAHRALPDRVDAACMLLEETAAAHGFGQARKVYGEVYAVLPDPAVTACFDLLLTEAGKTDAGRAPLMSVPEWMAKTDSALDFVGEREILHVEDPPTYGAPSTERLNLMVPGYVPYACTLREATLFARSSIVVASDGTALNDIIADPRFGHFLLLHHDPIVRARPEPNLLVLDTSEHQVTEMDAGVMLSGWVSKHFGHWAPEYLCRLAYLERHPRFAELPIIVDDDMPPQHLEFLSLLVPNRIVQIAAGEALRVGELVVGSPSVFFPVHLTLDHEVPPENQGGLPLGGLRYIQERVLRNLPPTGEADRRVYLSRRSSTWRRLLNEDEVSEVLAAMGFEILFPEEMTIEEQVRMYQGARVVVAPNGSALLNAIFAPKDVTLIVLSQRGLFNWGTYYGVMRDMGYDLTFLCADDETDEKHESYAIPIPRLLAAIEELTG
jgi:capsular polysaccharide biosynthesis protein